jgi:uncharacterized protein YggE
MGMIQMTSDTAHVTIGMYRKKLIAEEAQEQKSRATNAVAQAMLQQKVTKENIENVKGRIFRYGWKKG